MYLLECLIIFLLTVEVGVVYILSCYTLGVKAGNLSKGIPILFSPNFHVWILHLGILIQLTEFNAD